MVQFYIQTSFLRVIIYFNHQSMSRSPADRCTDSRSPTPAQKEGNYVSPARSPIKSRRTEGFKIHIGNLADDITNEELREKFAPFGTVKDVFIVKKMGFSFGFVTYERRDSFE